MLPLAGPHFPGSLEELRAALRAGFSGHGITVREVHANGAWPNVAELSIDLTGAHLSRATRLPKAGTEPQPGMIIGSLTISAAPLVFETTPVHLDFRASKAECEFTRDSADEPVLRLLHTENGAVSIEAQRADLEAMLKDFAHALLAKQGAEVKSAQLDLIDRGPRSLGFCAEITAKAFLMTARVVITGQLDLDEQLNLRVHDLTTSGDGMIASLAGGLLRPRFAEIEKRSVPLAAYSIAGVTLRGVRISGGNALRIEAQFGA